MQLSLLGPTLAKNQFKSRFLKLLQSLEAYSPHPSWTRNTSWEGGVGRATLLGKDLGLQNSNLEAYLLGVSFSHQISFMCHSLKR